MPLLEIENLSVEFPTAAGIMRAVDGVSLRLEEGEVLGVVGESGSGKSVTMLALMRLVACPGRVRAAGAEVRFVFADVSQEASVQAMVESAVQHYDRIDGLHCNAGVWAKGKATEFE